METQTKIILIIDGCLLVILLIGQIIRAVNNYREYTRFWKQLEARLKKQDEELLEKIFQALTNDPNFVKVIKTWACVLQKRELQSGECVDPNSFIYKGKYISDNPGWDKPKPSRLQRIKQWVIDIF